MIFLQLILAVVPLVWAVGPIGLQPYKLQQDCHVDCFAERLSKCECQNAYAYRCAGPTDRIFLYDCAPQIGKYPTTATTLKTKTRKPIGTPVPPADSGVAPTRPKTLPADSAVAPTRPTTPPSRAAGAAQPGLKGPRASIHPHPPEPPADPTVSRMCGSLGFRPCPDGQRCVDNPFVEGCLTALDCAGYCAVLDNSICGPVYGVACPIKGQLCVNDPREACIGGVCPGTCVFLNTVIAAGIA